MRNFLILLNFIAVSSFAQNAFSLKEAIDYAIENNYQSRNADLTIKSAKKKIWETTAIGLPQVSGNFQYQNRLAIPFDLEIPDPIPPGQEFLLFFAAQHNTDANLQANQLLFDGTYIVGLQASRTYAELSKREKDKTLVDINTQVTQAYYLVLISEENLKILEQTIDNIEQNYRETRALYKQGLIEEMDVDQLSLVKSDLEAQIANAKNQKDISYKMLQLSMGHPIDEQIELSDNLENIISQITIDNLVKDDFALFSNPEYRLLETRESLLKLDVKKNQWQRLPTLGAFYQMSAQTFQQEFDFYKDAEWLDSRTAGLSLNVPIFSSGQQGAKIAQAKIELEKLRNTKLYIENSLKIQYMNSIKTLESKYMVYQNAQKSLEIAEKIKLTTSKKHKSGIVGSFELTQAQNQYLEANGRYIQSLFELLNAKSELDKLQIKN